MKDFLLFRRMLTPFLLQLAFWLMVVVTVYFAILSVMERELIAGVVILGAGLLSSRIICEIMIVFFRIHDDLIEIRNNTRPKA